jgi:hypothetical protein
VSDTVRYKSDRVDDSPPSNVSFTARHIIRKLQLHLEIHSSSYATPTVDRSATGMAAAVRREQAKGQLGVRADVDHGTGSWVFGDHGTTERDKGISGHARHRFVRSWRLGREMGGWLRKVAIRTPRAGDE